MSPEITSARSWEKLMTEKALPVAMQSIMEMIGKKNMQILVQTYENFPDKYKTILLQDLSDNKENMESFIESESSMESLLQDIVKEVMAKKEKEEAVTVKEEAVTVKEEAVTVKEEAVTVKEEAVTVKEEAVTVKEEKVVKADEVVMVKEEKVVKVDIIEQIKEEVATVKDEKAVRVEKVAIIKEEALIVKDEKVVEDLNQIKEREKNLKSALKLRDDAFALFNGESGFNQKFWEKAVEWREKAKKDILDKPGANNLSQEELKNRIDISILATNKNEIVAWLSSEGERKKFLGITDELRLLAPKLDIPFDRTLQETPITVGKKESITKELIGLKPTDRVTQTGSEFRFGNEKDGYQVIDINTRPPTRSIESGGLRVTFDKTEKKEQNYRDQENYRESRGELTREIAELGKEIGDKREGMQEKYRLLGQMREDYRGGPEGSEEQKGLRVLIEKTEKELEDFKQKTERLTLLQATLKALDAAEALRTNGYQESLKSETESSRENLKYLESTHLAWLLGDSGMNLFITQINDHKDSYIQGSSELRLQTLWGPVEKNLFALGLKKLLWLDPKEMNTFFEPNGFDLRKFTDPPMKDQIKGKLKSNGTYGGEPPALSREKLINVMIGAKKE